MSQPRPAAVSTASEATGTLDLALAHASRLLTVDADLAVQQAEEILRVHRGHPLAIEILAKAHMQRSVNLSRAGQGDAAIAALKYALKLKPDLPQAWRALGDHLAGIGDDSGAELAYAQHVRHSTRDPVLLNAAAALQANRIPEAETLLRAHLKKAPTDVAALRMLAELAARIGRNDDALHLLEQCLLLAPEFHAARYHYAVVSHRANRPTQALNALEKLLQIEPNNPGYLNLKAVVLCRIGDFEPAIALYERILANYPAHPSIWMSFGHALKTAGHQERAISAYRQSLAQKPEYGEVWWSLANLKTFRFTEADIAVIREQLAKTELLVEHRLHLDFALGKALEDRAEYANAFSHYQQANALRRSQLHYRSAETGARVAHIKQHYDFEFFQQRANAGSPERDPIFIVGLPRAGSTLIEQILSSHSLVEGTMELPEITSLTKKLREQGDPNHPLPYHDVLSTLDAAALRELGANYLEQTRIHRKTDAPFFIDKMPNNFLHVGLIHLILPNARIIDARRHPLACGFSGYKQHFARGQSFTYSLEDIGAYYHDYVELMAHFDAVLPGRIHRIIYEQMVDNTEAEVRRLLDYCGLPFEDQCLRFFENTRPVRTASSEQVRQPIYREGIDHWRHFEAWLEPLKNALGPALTTYPEPPIFNR